MDVAIKRAEVVCSISVICSCSSQVKLWFTFRLMPATIVVVATRNMLSADLGKPHAPFKSLYLTALREQD